MFNANHYRAKADESTESLKHTDDPNEIRELQRSKKSFTALAQNEDWLANNFDNIIHSQDIPPHNDDNAGAPVAGTTVAETEEHIRPGAGFRLVFPTKLQRELFDTAGSMGDVLKSAALRAQIARFLHRHKDEASLADFVPKPNLAKETTQAT